MLAVTAALFLSGCVQYEPARLNLQRPGETVEQQQRYAAKFLYAHRILPAIAKNEPEDLARGLKSWPEIYLRRVWIDLQDINPGFVNAQLEQITAESFEGSDGTTIYLINLPPPEFSPEAYYAAFVYPAPEGHPPYYTLEKSARIETSDLQLELAAFGAWDGLTHYGLGVFDVLSGPDFVQLVSESLEEPFEAQVEDTQEVGE